MARRRNYPDPPFVDVYGRPIDPFAPQARPPVAAGETAESTPIELSEADVERVFGAICLIGSAQSKTRLAQFMRHLEWRHSRDGYFKGEDVAAAARRLIEQGRAINPPGEGFDVPPALRDAWLEQHLDAALAARAWPAWARSSSTYSSHAELIPAPHFRSEAEFTAFARLVLHAGLDAPGFERVRTLQMGLSGERRVIATAALRPFVPRLLEAMDPGLRTALLSDWLSQFDLHLPVWQPLLAWLIARVEAGTEPAQPGILGPLAQVCAQRGDLGGALRLLARLSGPTSESTRATVRALRGQWAEATAAFDAARKAFLPYTKAKKGLLMPQAIRWQLLALLAQDDPAAWTAARKLALTESGSRKPSLEGWGLWAHAAAARLGDEPVYAAAFQPRTGWAGDAHSDNADRLVLAAWLMHTPEAWMTDQVQAVVDGLEAGGQRVRGDLVRQAAARLGLAVAAAAGREPWPVAFYGARREAWRDALAAIAELSTSRGADKGPSAEGPLWWRLSTDAIGRVISVEPLERSLGARGLGRPKPVSLSKVKKSTRLDPRDAAVARCIDKTFYSRSILGIDVAGAAMALVQHPGVLLDDGADEPVELREALPELEVRRTRDAAGQEVFEFHLLDPLANPEPPDVDDDWTASSYEAETERRNAIRVLREGPDRARLIRITPAQRRVAELVAQRWAVPVDARAGLDAALRALAGHFQLLSDAAAGQAVACEPRLRAQLTPRGEALQLRLVVRPFGGFGPMLQPGHGRARAITAHEGLELSTERDLAAESAHLATVLDALPFLADTDEGDAAWLLDDPEQALTVLEVLPTLPAVAGLDWPRGKPVRVTPIASQGVKVALSTGRDWFTVDGEVQVDDTRVISLQRLMQLMRESRQGRFVALGEGEYLALTERLRAQLADLQAMAGSDKDGLRLPAAAAAFVAQALEGTALDADKPWAKRLARLEEAATLQPRLPDGLQAELRGYQAEGFAWMARLAHAGLGAILADDMGLGKTVQTLALLLTRAPLGPALVIAPTSVCGNWVAEAARFAPALRVLSFGEGDRAEMLQTCGPGDLVVASYALTQIEGEAFATREWATLVLDEAQALKNAATKRAKAIGTLKADFRLALSGTPVENRLADLWSLMNLLNPGLLGSSGQFTERFAGPIERQRDEAVRSRLRRLVSPFLLRRTKAQVLADLPPRTEIVHRVEPGPEERAFLEAARRSAVERVTQIDGTDAQASFHVLAELTRLRRAACDPRLAAPELGLVGAKVQEFEQLALELVAGRHKALVFSQFTDFLDLLAERLRATGIRHQMLTGSTPAAERTRRVAAFQAGEGDLFLISLKAGGFGLNLTAADYVIIVDPWWNPAAEDQASGRAHRIGQQRPVTVYRLVTAGSIEERIIELHRHKRDLADGILEGQDQGKPLGAAELRELLG